MLEADGIPPQIFDTIHSHFAENATVCGLYRLLHHAGIGRLPLALCYFSS
jgi:hypothetical protein